jgi:hypothetical protein
MAYKYISSTGKEYNLYYSKVRLRGGKQAKIYFLLPEGKEPTNRTSKAYLAESLPNAFEIREIGANKTPLVYKVRASYD